MAYEKGSKPEGGFKRRGPARRRKKVCVAIVKIFTPLRVDVKDEQVGLDISQHGESAYPSFNGLDQ